MKYLFACAFFLFTSCVVFAQPPQDSSANVADTQINSVGTQASPFRFLDSNMFAGNGSPLSLPVAVKQKDSPLFFYVTAGLFLILGLLRAAYSRYFNTLFRVFLNTSLRQSQLTDQLRQASVPSVIFNLFFAVSGGLYVFLLAGYFAGGAVNSYLFFLKCMAAVGGCYLVKYLSVLLAGWITGYRAEANSYLFVIFLLNKVVGIILLPFSVLIIFSTPSMISYAVFISIIFVSLILLVRFFRTWSMLQNRLKVSRFHFFLYIIALELLPILLIYKAVLLFTGKSS